MKNLLIFIIGIFLVISALLVSPFAFNEEVEGHDTDWRLVPVATGFNGPVDISFIDGDEFYLIEKGGREDIDGNVNATGTARVYHVTISSDGASRKQILTLPVNVYNDFGLIGITTDPVNKNIVYLYYVSTSRRSTLARYHYNGTSLSHVHTYNSLGIDLNVFHAGGAMGWDGNKLMLAIGDGGKADIRSQDLSVLDGKVVRIIPKTNGYDIPSDNPYRGVSGVRQEIWARGLRSPHAGASHNNVFYVGDVGSRKWEEVNIIERGGNYGWPMYEGECITDTFNCGQNNPAYKWPLVSWAHFPGGGGSVSTVCYQGEGTYPPAYNNSLFFGDMIHGWLKSVDVGSRIIREVLHPPGFPVNCVSHEGKIWIVEFIGGNILRLDHLDGGINPQFEILSDLPIPEGEPLRFRFSDGIPETFDSTTLSLDFGDGTGIHEFGEGIHSYLYEISGNMRITGRACSDTECIPIIPVEVTVQANDGCYIEVDGPPLYSGGSSYTFTNSCGGNGYWEIRLVHNTHWHVQTTANNTSYINFEIGTASHENDDAELSFRAVFQYDGGTLQASIYPDTYDIVIRFEDYNARYPVYINGIRPKTTPYTFTGVKDVIYYANQDPDRTIIFYGKVWKSLPIKVYFNQSFESAILPVEYVKEAEQFWMPIVKQDN